MVRMKDGWFRPVKWDHAINGETDFLDTYTFACLAQWRREREIERKKKRREDEMAGRHTCNVSCAHSGKETLRAPGKKTLIGRKEVSGEGRGKLLRKLRRFEYICLIKKKNR